MKSLFMALCLVAVAAGGLQGCAAPEIRETQATAAPASPAELERRARLRLELAGGYFARGQSATALDEVRQALSTWPQLVEGHNLSGLIHAAMGENAKAEEAFQRALQIKPSDPDTLHNLGWFRCQQRQFAEADALFQQALAQPQHVGALRTLLARGVCQARAGRWAEAEVTLTRAYELDAANPTTAVNLSEVLLKRGQLERARFYVRRVNDRPDLVSAQSLWLAARVEHRAGNLELAREIGNRMAQRFPQSPEAARFARGQFDDQ